MSWCGTETPEFDEKFVDAESIDKVEKETAELLANIKGDRPWMTALKQRSKEIKESKAHKSPQAAIKDADQRADGKKAPPAAAKNTKLAASSAKAQPPPPAAKAEAPDPNNVPPCNVGDIVVVKTSKRKQHDGFKAKVLTVLCGVASVEMLEGPTVGTKEGKLKFKFIQAHKLPSPDEKAEPENKEGEKQTKPKDIESMSLNEWYAATTQGVP